MEVDFKSINEASVYLRQTLVGKLRKFTSDKGTPAFGFQYSPEYLHSKNAISVAISLPLQATEVVQKELHPFFDNLISEGWLLSFAEKVHHIDKRNRFALLMATGGNTIGAVSVRPLRNDEEIDLAATYDQGKTEETRVYEINELHVPYCLTCFSDTHPKCTKELWGTQKKLTIELAARNPIQSFSKVIYGGSISGAQRKGVFYLDSSGTLIPTAQSSEYILKPQGDYPELPENEHITMAIAAKAGIDIPPFTLLDVEEVGRVFAIKRFDRVGAKPLKLEDMGQIIDVPSGDKYESSYEKVAKAIEKNSSAPIVDLDRFFRRVAFCYLVCNGDMHLKNWSLLETEETRTYKLSPAYDLLNTRLPLGNDEKIDTGLKLNGKDRKHRPSDFVAFGRHIELKDDRIKLILSQANDWMKIIEKLVPKSFLLEESKSIYVKLAKERAVILESALKEI